MPEENRIVTVTREALIKKLAEVAKAKNIYRLILEIADMVEAKNSDYGDAWQEFGVFTSLIRINEKLLRLRTLVSGKKALVVDEGIEDTLRDIIGCAVLDLLYIEKERELKSNMQDTPGYVQLELFPEKPLAIAGQHIPRGFNG